LVVDTTGRANFKLSGLSANLDLYLYDPGYYYDFNRSPLGESRLSGTSVESIDYDIAPGIYYLLVDSYQYTDPSSYTLSVDLPETNGDDVIGSTSVGDAGSRIATAAGLIASDTTITGSVGYGSDNRDYYKLVVDTTGLANFKLSGVSADLDLYLYDPSHHYNFNTSPLEESRLSGTSDESIDYAIAPGTYYLLVDHPYTSTDNSFYTLSVDLPETSGDDVIGSTGVGDAGASISTAAGPIAGDTTITGSVGYGYDTSNYDTRDYYKLVVDTAGLANFTLSGLSADLDLYLYDPGYYYNVNRSPLGESRLSGTSVESIDYDIAPGTYYLLVDRPSTSTNHSFYTLSVDLPGTGPSPTTSSVSIGSTATSQTEGQSGLTPFTFNVNRTGDTSAVASVDWSVAGSGAAPADASDFSAGTLPSGTLSFAAGETSKTITVNVAGDTTVEADETFTVTLNNPVNLALASASSVTSQILNDDSTAGTLPSLAIAPSNQPGAEGNTGSTAYTFEVTRTGDLSGTSSSAWSVTGSGNTPANAADFVGGILPSGNITFEPGQSSATLTVNVAGDTAIENDEGFVVTLANPVGATLSSSSMATSLNYIINDDQGTTPLPLSKSDEFVVLQPHSPSVVGAGSGNDTYLISGSMIPAGKSFTISDAIGSNSIQLASGLSITDSQVTGSALNLNLSNGAAVTVLGADNFTYDVGGNTSAARDNPDVSYQDFVTGTLGTTIPASGVATGSNRIIDSTTPASLLASTSAGDDFVALQYASPTVVGAGAGNDTYLITNDLLPAGTELTISDAIGANSIQLAPGLSIASSQVTSTALQLTLASGATVTILGANNFTYDVGANTTAGINNADVNFATFVESTLNTTVPTSGVMNGASVVIGGNSVTVQGTTTVNATEDDEIFQFDAVTALLDPAGTNTQATITGFASSADTLRIDLPSANATITNLSQLTGQQDVFVQTDTINPGTLINFGNDANGGEVVSLTLMGITDPELVDVQVV